MNKFFYDIYLNSDEDMRSFRANQMWVSIYLYSYLVFLLSWRLQCFCILIDSFAVLHNQQVESNGTVLSIDWKDVSAKKIESTLHVDLALKTWEIWSYMMCGFYLNLDRTRSLGLKVWFLYFMDLRYFVFSITHIFYTKHWNF